MVELLRGRTEIAAADKAGDAARDERISVALWWSLVVGVNLAAAGWLVWLLASPLGPDSQFQVERRVLPEFRPPAQSEFDFPRVPFVDATQTSGIDFTHFSHRTGEYRMPENVGSGCAFFDYDNDGDADVLLVNGTYLPEYRDEAQPPGTTALYQNAGDGTFRNVTSGSGLDVELFGMGAATGDFNGDGLTDVFIATLGTDRLFRNLGQGKFLDVTETAGVAGSPANWSTSCGFFDYDRDGWLDLFVCTYGSWSMELDRSLDHNTLGALSPISPLQVPGGDCVLYRNRGDGTFEDVSEKAGIQVRNAFTRQKAARALAVRFCDLDRDGWMDVIVANDLCPAFLFHNQGDGTFVEIARDAGIAFDESGGSVAGMGVDVADLHGQGDLAIVVTNFHLKPTVVYREQGQRLKYRDESRYMGVALYSLPLTSWGVFFFDADLDGRPDMFQCSGTVVSEAEARLTGAEYFQPCQLYWNAGAADGRRNSIELALMPPSHCGEAFYRPMMARGAAYADIDGDGDLDVLVSQSNGPAQLFRNDQKLGRHWLRVKLRGRAPNWEAIGARIELTAGGLTQQQDVMPTRSYMSQVELPVTFGLGETDSVDSLTVFWPDGSQQSVTVTAVDQELVVEQTTTAAAPDRTSPSSP